MVADALVGGGGKPLVPGGGGKFAPLCIVTVRTCSRSQKCVQGKTQQSTTDLCLVEEVMSLLVSAVAN